MQAAANKASKAPLYLGRGYAGHFGGLIDEVALWKRALPAEDVAALYWNTPRPPEQAAAKNLALKAK